MIFVIIKQPYMWLTIKGLHTELHAILNGGQLCIFTVVTAVNMLEYNRELFTNIQSYTYISVQTLLNIYMIYTVTETFRYSV